MSSYSYWSCPLRGLSLEKFAHPSLSTPFVSSQYDPTLQFCNFTVKPKVKLNRPKRLIRNGPLLISCCSDYTDSIDSPSSFFSPSLAEGKSLAPIAEEIVMMSSATGDVLAPEADLPSETERAQPPKVRNRYRKLNPGEKEGITEEMRFVAMKLRNVNGKKVDTKGGSHEDNDGSIASPDTDGGSGRGETWQPTIDGFLRYLVDSKLVFDTIERIVDESKDVSYAYFRRTGLERSEGLSKDLEWFSEQEILIPQPSNPGGTYAKYLEELAETSAPSFLCHFYNIYFSHVAGGQVTARQVSEKLLEGRELRLYRWERNPEESLKGVREKLNMLGENWTRHEKNKCLRETTKSFRYLGQIVRLIIL